ncbi:MAG: sulfotransferase [Myxococcota bacterium]
MIRSLGPPVVVTGMHRSGTSMLSRMLGALGFFFGNDQSGNAESLFFQRLNRSICAEAGGSWSQVGPVVAQMSSRSFVARQASYINNELRREKGLLRHLGLRNRLLMFLGRSVWWGWKDPRNTITMPVWLVVFPGLRVIHTVRSGIDAAISLHRREMSRSEGDPDLSEGCLEFAACFALWEEYEETWRSHRRLIAPANRLEVRYEDLLANPEDQLGWIMSFIGRDISRSMLAEVAMAVDRDRLDNRRSRNEYREAIDALPDSATMRRLGYQMDRG